MANTGDDWVQRLDKILPSSCSGGTRHPRIAIFGSVEFYHKDSPALCDEIGRELARNIPDACILTGANAIAQERLSKAFRDEYHLCSRNDDNNNNEDDPLIFHLAPVRYACDFGFGSKLEAGHDMAARRFILANLADVCMVIEGGPGSVDEMTKAQSAGKVVIPLIRTGGAAGGMFGAPSCLRPSFVQESDWSLLADETATVEDSAKAVVSIIQSTVQAKYATTKDIKRNPVSSATKTAIEKIVSGSMNVTYSKRPTLPDTHSGYVEPTLAGSAHLIFKGDEYDPSDGSCFGNIYLGPKDAADPPAYDQLIETNIGGIVNCTIESPCHFHHKNIKYCKVTIHDEYGADILTFLEGATGFIHHLLVNRRCSVLVHCERGVSRSATIVIAYLIRYRDMTRDEAYLYVKARRPVASPNPGFWDQLQVFEEQCRSKDASQGTSQTLSSSADPSFNETWARKSNAVFATSTEIPDVVENDESMMCLAKVNCQAKLDEVLLVCLDFLWGRGVKGNDLDWFEFVCQIIDRNCTVLETGTADAVKNMLEDPESEFSHAWSGEIYEDQIQRVLRKLNF